MSKILIADDDASIAELVSDALSDEGFECEKASDGNQALRKIKSNPDYALILLDIMMPGTDGLEVCRKVRDEVDCPIIFMSAKNRTLDTLLGLGMGADDYITKPFVLDELVARVKAHVRRDKRAAAHKGDHVIKSGDIEIHKDNFEVYLKGERVPLSAREFQLLQYLVENEGKVLTREQIFNAVWGKGYGDIGTVAVNIKNLRAKIDLEGRTIKTVWGVGYMFGSHEKGDKE